MKAGLLYISPVLILSALLMQSAGGAKPEDRLTASLKDVKDLRMPLEYYPNGEIKSQLFAERASVPTEEGANVEAKRVRAEFYDESGKVDLTIKSDGCSYSRKSGIVKSDGRVTVEKEGVFFSGKGYEWDSKGRHVKILHDVEIRIRKGLDIGTGSLLERKDRKL